MTETAHLTLKKVMRTGVYGVAMGEEKLLLIRQIQGPYAGRFDFPGGGIEFGESPEEALRREFLEEVAMEFDSMAIINNFTATVDIPGTISNEPYKFCQIGLIYRVTGYRSIKDQRQGEFPHEWVDLATLSESQCSKLLWKYKIGLGMALHK